MEQKQFKSKGKSEEMEKREFQQMKQSTGDDKPFSVVSYNILADAYCTPVLFKLKAFLTLNRNSFHRLHQSTSSLHIALQTSPETSIQI
jgi:mRNA deadenylase 3'-5' endonuclease subunit Ccr4